ncbi:MAG: putative RNA-binding protein containing a Zn-ribbon-like motif [Microbacterium sp.]|jgi:predicted RNA-binding Zn ribbon-like protein|nr:putative RNA-binding protein containing a Zn-ribbon-like motif [Microbacterium sp.]
METQADLAFARENEVIPDAVRLVRDFVNTVEYQVDDERLVDATDLRDWLVARALLDAEASASPDDVAFARRLREGLRSVLQVHAGHEADESAIRDLDEALEELPVRGGFDASGAFRLAPASPDPVRAALGRLLDAVRLASEDDTWSRLKVCARDSCRWAYYDHSRNRSSRWCTMAGCGNAMKMQRAYRSRKAAN